MALQKIDWQDAIADFLMDVRGSHELKTVMFYQAQLRLLSRWAEGKRVRLQDFRAKDMREYLAGRVTVSDATRRHDAVCAKALLRFCYHEGYIDADPLRDYKIPKAAKPYIKMPSDDEIRAILKGLTDRWQVALNPATRPAPPRTRAFYSRRNVAIVGGLLETACRIGEICALKISDYQPDRRQIQIRTSKGNEPRTIPISLDWIAAVDAWLKVRPKCDVDWLFIGCYGEPLTALKFGKQFQGYCKYAAVEEVTLHSLRHYALTQIAKQDVWAAMQIAGHKDLKVTRGYLHGDPEHVRRAHADAAPLSRLLVNKRSERQARRKRLI